MDNVEKEVNTILQQLKVGTQRFCGWKDVSVTLEKEGMHLRVHVNDTGHQQTLLVLNLATYHEVYGRVRLIGKRFSDPEFMKLRIAYHASLKKKAEEVSSFPILFDEGILT